MFDLYAAQDRLLDLLVGIACAVLSVATLVIVFVRRLK